MKLASKTHSTGHERNIAQPKTVTGFALSHLITFHGLTVV